LKNGLNGEIHKLLFRQIDIKRELLFILNMRTGITGITQLKQSKGKKKVFIVTKYGVKIGAFYTFIEAKEALDIWLKEYDSNRILYPKCAHCVSQKGLQVLPLNTYTQIICSHILDDK
jgi:hypothetical protein